MIHAKRYNLTRIPQMDFAVTAIWLAVLCIFATSNLANECINEWNGI